MHWLFETASSRARLQYSCRTVAALLASDRFLRKKPLERKENFKSVAESGTKSAALSGYSLVVERKLPKL